MHRVICILTLQILACRSGAASTPAVGEIAASWTGSAQGSFRAPATARWCARDSLLELLAVRNDTAVGFALLPKDTISSGVYSIFPSKVFIAFRPQANAAVRWLDNVELKGFEAVSGVVTLQESGASGVSGTFEVRLGRAENPDTLALSGSFSGVPVGRAIDGCGRANRPGAG